mmetsp:Transcript_5545/g.20859  ORF Transcript_5545/g.20859 Transcript_5545/m.20859 type:complete len:179 (-) Transcript_5545:142-678(-)|eukprot:CAMPEP_0117443902 /NCGR_PEP_ID=MMETSP0759-20121206/4950_1 /TAXON_ID=63605 /ORGANISM="Percolomonas cosmopolitus, Strain WS" /LENGTH=178 /DNA_ID=CAMNT_0005235923 /DNA_START=49 /DNA_END=585 /DNA_ORIENTATION=+
MPSAPAPNQYGSTEDKSQYEYRPEQHAGANYSNATTTPNYHDATSQPQYQVPHQHPQHPQHPQPPYQQQPYGGYNPHFQHHSHHYHAGGAVRRNNDESDEFMIALLIFLIAIIFFPLLLIVNLKFLKSKNEGARIISYISLILLILQFVGIGLGLLGMIPILLMFVVQIIAASRAATA